MPKPGSGAEFRPSNSLVSNRRNIAPRVFEPKTFYSASQFVAIPLDSTQPPPKRQRIDRNEADTPHSQAIAISSDPPTATVSQKRPREDSPITDSQLSQGTKSAKTESTPIGLSEFQAVEQHTNPPNPRKRRRRHPSSAPDECKKYAKGNSEQSRPVEEISDDDMGVNLVTIKHRPNNDIQPQTDGKGGFRPAPEFSKYWSSGPNKFQEAIDRAEKKKGMKMTTLMNGDESPDELAHSTADLEASNRLKPQRTQPPSVSRNGDIKPTHFMKGASAANTKQTQHPEPHRHVAKSVIGRPLRVLRGASGHCGYVKDHSKTEVFLFPREISHTLHAVDHSGEILRRFSCLTLNCSNASKILYSQDDEKSCIVVINQMHNATISAGAKLFIEFESRDSVDEVVAWIKCQKKDHGFSFVLQHCPTAQLNKQLAEMMARAHLETVLLDDDPVDLRLMQQNQDNRMPERNYNAAAASSGRPKLRDGMEADQNRNVTFDRSPSTQQENGLSLGQRPTRQKQKTTRSYFAVEDSPEPQEPEPERWTLVNQGWENKWRNSLVFPEKGKNRATVDKDDIQRLDEGEFLNDNIIIFYLRYLQQTLEAEQPTLAKRIYFQNTFFYDQLKPVKASQGIQYEKVKTWTSKVDLFEKDFIIVPINEYSHWYVAIICHAPKLVSASDNAGNTTVAAPNTITIPDELDGIKEKPLPSIQESSKEDVIEHLKRMSIGSPSHPINMTKKAVETSDNVEEQSIPIEQCQEVRVVSDVTKPEPDTVHSAPQKTSPRRKKAGKRQNTARKSDPTQPRIITLDSLGGTHSPTCGNLRQYLMAELQEKKKVTMVAPGPSGMTARGVPEQSNHCDCGLYLLGYIQQFLQAPDDFVRRLCQRDDPIAWNLNPSTLRNEIRDLIFDLQVKQQRRENAAQEEKRKRKTPQKTDPSARIRPSIEHPDIVLEQQTIDEIPPSNKSAHFHSSPSRSNLLKLNHHVPHPCASTSDREQVLRHHKARTPNVQLLSSGPVVDVDPKVSHVNNPRKRPAESMARLQPELNVHVASLPETTAVAMSSQSAMPGAFPVSPTKEVRVRSQSRESEGTNLQNRLVKPMSSLSPSSISSRNGTPRDPVVLDDSELVAQPRGQPSPRERTSRIVVELSSQPRHRSVADQATGKAGEALSPMKSHHFPDRARGEIVTAAKLSQPKPNEKPPKFIDLSDVNQ
ncbi:hypothetical protein F5Y18DRAFT_268322 [Xylariaceae sp. FL1019]|nr:hypothetical protein F5Y18DRAFT_268322 [Xylariaceae sp. FL1019]